MDYDQFLTIVEQAAGVDRQTAERATQATLQTLAERVAGGEDRQLAAQLPPELAPYVGRLVTAPAEPFDADEFVRRVAEREGADPDTARGHAKAVLAALGRAVSPKEYDDVVAELPRDYAPLVGRGPWVELMPEETFVQRVAQQASIDADAGRRATEAVLETLAERIADGEVDDVVARLAPRLQEPLERGRRNRGREPVTMALDDFLERVAEREGVNIFDARDHTRAVMLTLREAVGDAEFHDITVELPEEYKTRLALLRH